jgi:plasmid maintenance system antidote protein VapI
MFWKKSKETLQTDYIIAFKENAIDIIKKAKGWKTDAELARKLNFTRQYICSLKKRKTPCTHDVIVRIAAALGNTNENWWNHFEIISTGKYQPNHQKWNQAKYEGKNPYDKFSTAAIFREKDQGGDK